MAEPLVVDASAFVELLLGTNVGAAVGERLRGNDLHAPAHLDAEIISALGRLHRASSLTAEQVEVRLPLAAAAPIERHLLAELLVGAWRRRDQLRLADALYVELAASLGARLVTTDAAMARATLDAELVDS